MKLCALDNKWRRRKIITNQSCYKVTFKITALWPVNHTSAVHWITHNVVVLCLLNLPQWSLAYRAMVLCLTYVACVRLLLSPLGRRKRNQYGGASEMVSQTNGRSKFWREKEGIGNVNKICAGNVCMLTRTLDCKRGRPPKGTDQTPDCKGIAFRQLYRFRRGI